MAKNKKRVNGERATSSSSPPLKRQKIGAATHGFVKPILGLILLLAVLFLLCIKKNILFFYSILVGMPVMLHATVMPDASTVMPESVFVYFREYRCRNGVLENRIYSGLNSLYVDLYFIFKVRTH
jgi:hypothetical protein